MKKLLVIVMAVALVSICSAASAATILSDNDLGELYAADIAVAAQTNNAVIVAVAGDIQNVLSGIRQRNYAKVKREVNELNAPAIAVAAQTNNAALSAGRDINNVDIKQKNKAVVVGDVTGLFSTTLAVGAQTNTALLGSTSGSINGVSISQSNRAYVGSGAPL